MGKYFTASSKMWYQHSRPALKIISCCHQSLRKRMLQATTPVVNRGLEHTRNTSACSSRTTLCVVVFTLIGNKWLGSNFVSLKLHQYVKSTVIQQSTKFHEQSNTSHSITGAVVCWAVITEHHVRCQREYSSVASLSLYICIYIWYRYIYIYMWKA